MFLAMFMNVRIDHQLLFLILFDYSANYSTIAYTYKTVSDHKINQWHLLQLVAFKQYQIEYLAINDSITNL